MRLGRDDGGWVEGRADGLTAAETVFSPVMGWDRASLVAQMVNNLPAVQETRVRSLGWEDPLEEGMAPYPSFLGWRVPQTAGPGRLQPTGSQSRTRLSD